MKAGMFVKGMLATSKRLERLESSFWDVPQIKEKDSLSCHSTYLQPISLVDAVTSPPAPDSHRDHPQLSPNKPSPS